MIHRGPMRTALCCLALASAYSSAVGAVDWKVTPTLRTGATLSDNINLSPDKTGDMVLIISPGVTVVKDRGRLRAQANYQLENIISLSESDRNTSYHNLNANATAELLRDRFFVDANASIAQTNISPFGIIGIDNVNRTNNRTTVKSFGITSRYIQRLGSFATGQARYTHGEAHYTDAFSTRINDAVFVSLDSGSRFNTVGWGLAYSNSQSDTKTVDTSAESSSAYLAYIFSPRLRFKLTGGYEKLELPTQNKAPEGEFWSVGIDYAPGPLTTLTASVGRRFFGDTRAFHLTRKSAHSTWLVNYSRDIANEEVVLPVIQPGFLINPITGAPALDPVTGLPASVPVLLFVRFSETFLTSLAETSYSYEKGKSRITVSAFDKERDSQLRALKINETGANALWNLRVFPRTTADLGLGLLRSRLQPLDRQDTYTYLTVGATHRLSAKSTASLTYRHQRRNSNRDPDYNENSLAFFVNMRF